MRPPTPREITEGLISFVVGFIGLGLVILATPVSAAIGGAWGLTVGILMIVVGLIAIQHV